MSAPESPGSPRIAFVVAGMHRSGTSAMAKVLNFAGAAMPKRVIAAGEDNPRGFWEPRDMVALNDEILGVAGYAWNHIFSVGAQARLGADIEAFRDRARKVVALNYASVRQAVLKDPRTSLVSSLWCDALEAEGFKPVFVILVRHPLEVARSIAKRDGAPVEASALAWLNHMVAIERDTRDRPRIFVSYDGLLNDWRRTLEDISRTLDAPLMITDEVADQIEAFLSKSERHHTLDGAADPFLSELWPPVAEAWRWAAAAAAEPDRSTEMPRSVIDALLSLEQLMGPVFSHQHVLASRERAAAQALLGDREVLRLRAEARVGEYQELTANLTRQHVEEIGRRDAVKASLSSDLDQEHQATAQLSDALHVQQTALNQVELEARQAAQTVERVRQEMQSRLSLQNWFSRQSEATSRAQSLAALDAARTEIRSLRDENTALSMRFDMLGEAFSYLEKEHQAMASASVLKRFRALLADLWPSSR